MRPPDPDAGPHNEADRPPPARPGPDRPSVLDLFSGLGGLATGFHDAGFEVEGVDREPLTAVMLPAAGVASVTTADLSTRVVYRSVPVLTGGPPCRPWSMVNLRKRGTDHADHGLLDRFFLHVREIRPEVFVLENVLAMGSDATYLERVRELRTDGYSVATSIVRYSDLGAPTSRRRLFTVGVRASRVGGPEFFGRLQQRHVDTPTTVRDAIAWARDLPRGGHADHDWSQLRSIGNYDARYSSGQYGWCRLSYDVPAPSFGSIAKTYILHPEAGAGGYELRVLSVREAMSIMGFPRAFGFPARTARTKRYRMVADAVSPPVARVCGQVVRGLLDAGSGGSPFYKVRVATGGFLGGAKKADCPTGGSLLNRAAGLDRAAGPQVVVTGVDSSGEGT